MTLQWIAIRSKPRSEKVAVSELTKKGIETFLPLIKKRQQWSDRSKWVEFPLFPSYLFAKIELKNSIYVLQTQGVNTIIKFSSKVVVVDDVVVKSLKLALEGGFELHSIKNFMIGQNVQVVDGPMKGARGIVNGKKKNDGRLIIKVEALQRAVAVHIDSHFLERIIN